ncbi:MAG: hypothetical protein P4N59_11160 [Negativicutes bacterium]|nr:hypothetical protein [Negativicutes bacterium]
MEELLRRLFLTSFVVLLRFSKPLAVFVSVFAHVLHGMYEPWGFGSQTYYLQHLSLACTSFVFLMGLLFLSGSMSNTSPTGLALSVCMLLLFTAFLLIWIVVMLRAVYIGYMAARRVKRLTVEEGGRRGSMRLGLDC